MAETHLLAEVVKNGSEEVVAHLLEKRDVLKDVNKLSTAEEAPLHIATWRNHAGICRALLAAGANPDLQDGESGWTALHKALYWGQLHMAGLLLSAGASLDVADHQGRTPVDLVTRELGRYCQQPHTAAAAAPTAGSGPAASCKHATQVFSWGSGANYQLGTGSTDFAEAPVRVEAFGWEEGGSTPAAGSSGGSMAASSTPDTSSAAAAKLAGPAAASRAVGDSSSTASVGASGGGQAVLGGSPVVALAAAKFHSAAVTADGRLWTWGWGRGGRLGHPGFNIHSGEAALIRPWAVSGLGKRQVVSVAAGKHHMLVATSAGEVWSWGVNRDARLGYGGVDTQPTPCKIASFARGTRIVMVAAANKHSAALSSAGEVFTWGANGHGQLGYGTTGGAANPTPRVVDALKGRVLRALSAAKCHTAVVSAEGEVWVWGHRVVTPRRLLLAGCRDTTRLGPAAAASGSSGASGHAPSSTTGGESDTQLVFHRGHAEVVRPHAVAVAAGYSHTTVVTRDGVLLVWRSGDPSLRVTEVGGTLAGMRVVGISAGKTRTAAVTADGDVYAWEAERGSQGAGGGSALRAARGSDSGGAQLSSSYVDGGDVGSYGAGLGSGGTGVLGSSCGAFGSIGGLAMAGAALEGRVRGAGGGGGGAGVGGVTAVRVPGLKRAAAVAVGEKHTLALCAWTMPPLPDERGVFPAVAAAETCARRRRGSGSQGDTSSGSDDDGLELDGAEGSSPSAPRASSVVHHHHHHCHHLQRVAPPSLGLVTPSSEGEAGSRPAYAWAPHDPSDPWSPPGGWLGAAPPASRVPSLQVVAQRVVAMQLVEPRTVLQILEYADVAGAALLRAFCIAVALRNLDAVLAEAPSALTSLPPHLLAELEQHYKAWLQPTQAGMNRGGPDANAGGARPGSAVAAGAGGGWGEEGRSGVRGGSGPHTPALGSSPVSGSWLERAAERYLPAGSEGGSGSAPVTVERSSTGAHTGVNDGSGAGGAGHRRRHWLSKLQLPRRPTSVPPWLDGRAVAEGLLPAVSSRLLAHVSQTALSAIGHTWRVGQAGGEPQAPSPMGSLGAAGVVSGGEDTQGPRFLPHGSTGPAAEAAAAVERLARGVAKKLAQINVLEERAREGTPLDAQQLGKLGQKAPLLEALHMLEAGAPMDAVQAMLAHAQHVAGKLAGDSGAAGVSGEVAGSAARAGGEREGGGRALDAAAGGAGSKGKDKDGRGRKAQAGGVETREGRRQQEGGAAGKAAPPTPSQIPQQPQQQAGAGAGGSTPGDRPKDKGAARKGDLSAFLSGALDKRTPPPPPPGTEHKPKGAAWGGAAALQAASMQPLKPLIMGGMGGSSAGAVGGIPAAAGPGANPAVLPIAAAAGGTGGAVATPPSVPPSLRELLGPQVAAGSISAAAGGKGAGTGGNSSSSAWVTPQPKSRAMRDAPTTPLFTTPAPAPPFPAPSPYSASSQHTLIFAPDGATPAPPTPPTPSAPVVRTLSLADFMATPKPVKPPATARAEGPAWGGAAVPGSSPAGRPTGAAAAATTAAAAAAAAKQRTLREIQAEQEAARAAAPMWRGGTGGAGPSKPGGGEPQAGVKGTGDMAIGSSAGAAAPKVNPGRSKGGSKGVAITVPLAGLAVGGGGGGAGALVSGSSPPASKWYVPEQHRPQPLPAIQTEERAITEIAALYKGKGVTVARSGTKPHAP